MHHSLNVVIWSCNTKIMKKISFVFLVAVLLVGCNQNKDKILDDPITLNLVKQSVNYTMYTNVFTNSDYEYTYYNSCSTWSRFKARCNLLIHPSMIKVYRNVSCDALDLRLKNQNINISSSALVAYYMDKQQSEQDKAKELLKQQEQLQHQQLIESMAKGD